jgi:hypothetical protein
MREETYEVESALDSDSQLNELADVLICFCDAVWRMDIEFLFTSIAPLDFAKIGFNYTNYRNEHPTSTHFDILRSLLDVAITKGLTPRAVPVLFVAFAALCADLRVDTTSVLATAFRKMEINRNRDWLVNESRPDQPIYHRRTIGEELGT